MAGSRTLKLSILADVDDLKKKLDTGSKEVESFGGKLGEFGKKAAAAFAVAGAAAAAYAGKLLIDGVKAAIADEAAQLRLATALKNATNATDAQIASTEDYITKTSLAVGVTDDELRPSLQRLAIATNDVSKAQQLQTLALDISAGSGKSLEAVTNALAKAYEGNNSSLTRLGVGLTTAELKSMSFDEVTKELAATFGGQASEQADTFQGKLTRLQIGFDEAKEAVGSRLIPILTNLLNLFVDKVIPAAQGLLEKFQPLTKAIEDNKDEFKALWSFIDKFIVPILTGVLKTAFNGIVTTVTTLVNVIGRAVDFFESLYNAYKKFVDFLKNNPLSKWLGSINPFNNASFSTSNASFLTAGPSTGFADERRTTTNPFDPTATFVPTERYLEEVRQTEELKKRTEELRAQIEGRAAARNERNININVNAPSIIDEEGFTRAVIDALNGSQARTGSLATLTI